MGSPGFVISGYLPHAIPPHPPLLSPRLPLPPHAGADGGRPHHAGTGGRGERGRRLLSRLPRGASPPISCARPSMRCGVKRTRPFGVNFLLAPPEGTPTPDQVERTRAALSPLRARLGLTSPGPLPPLPASELDRQARPRTGRASADGEHRPGLSRAVLARLRSTETVVLAMVTTPGEAAGPLRQGPPVSSRREPRPAATGPASPCHPRPSRRSSGRLPWCRRWWTRFRCR